MPPDNQTASTSIESATPLIRSDQSAGDNDTAAAAGEKDPKTGKRRFFGLGSKREEKDKSMAAPLPSGPATLGASPASRPPDLKPTAQPIPLSPSRHPYPSFAAASPSRLRSSSPRLHSPASSEIFERNVQEPVPIADLQGGEADAASHIPTHVITEDHIPPALEASAQAITSEELNPDEVEIVMSSSHQPAAASVLDGGHRESQADIASLQSPMSPLQPVRSEDSELAPSGILPQPPPPGAEEGDGASNYGQLDPNDVRRLSFISFADVVQSEHQQQGAPPSALGEPGSRDSLHIASLPGSFKAERAGSPLRSPPSTHSQSLSGGVTTPPPGLSINPAEAGGAEQSPGRLGSPVSPTPQGHGDLTVETMRQAVRKTASGDLTGGATGRTSTAMSPVDSDGNRSRTNS